MYLEGGFLRFYRGYLPALAQGPISRFGDTAANAGVLALLAPHDSLPMAVKTGVASTAAGAWRIVIMPIDAVKTTLQVRFQQTDFLMSTTGLGGKSNTVVFDALLNLSSTLI